MQLEGNAKLTLVAAAVVAVLLSLGIAPADSPASPAPLLVQNPAPEAKPQEAKKEEPKKEEPKKEEKKEEKAFADVVKDYEVLTGLFTLYRKADEGRLLIEILPEQFDRGFLYSSKMEGATGEKGLYGTIMMSHFVFQWRRLGNRVQFVNRNLRFRANDGQSPVKRAIEKSFADSVLTSGKIQSQPHPERKSVLVDLADIFTASDFHGLAPFLKQVYDTQFTFSKDDSGFFLVKAFPKNVELGTVALYRAQEFKETFTLPDARSLQLRFRYSLATLPENDYRPRLADDRVGHFPTIFQDLSSQSAEVPYVRYVQRWHLVKADPNAKLSPPKEPIVFWLENTIPLEYRDAIRDGILLWNAAFERAGFKDAVVVKQQPDDADWDPADIRYNTVRWFAGFDATFAIGPSHVNPYTGQLLDADIGISDGIIRFTRAEFVEFVNPVQNFLETDSPALPWQRDPGRRCDFAEGFARQAALGYEMLQARGDLTPEKEKEYVRQYILELMAHEVGHTLGLRHNFRASTINRLDQLHDRTRTNQVGIGASVMDYNPNNIAPRGQPQGDYFMTRVGSYDHWAIEYAYKPLPGAKTPEEELPELRKIAARAADPLLPYATDEDTGLGPRTIDPRNTRWDWADDNLAFFRRRIQLVEELFANMEKKLLKPGEGYQVLRRSFNGMQFEYLIAALSAGKYIGGIYHNRDHVGDPGGRPPYVPVPATRQREALAFLAEKIFAPDAFQAPTSLLNNLALERQWDFRGTVFTSPRIDYPLHQVVLNIQRAPLTQLYDPITLQRLLDLEVKFENPADRFTLADMFNGLLDALWSELDAGTNISSFRRNLQRDHLTHLVRLTVKPQAGTPEDARTLAAANLRDLWGKIDRQLSRGSLDYTSRAHLEQTRARIEAALKAQLQMPVE